MAFVVVPGSGGVDTYFVDEDNGVTTGTRTSSGSNDVLTEELTWENGSAVAGEDYTADAQTLTFPAESESSQPYTFAVIDDDIVEDDEFFYRVIREDGVVVAREEFVILDDDQSTATIEPLAATVVEAEGAVTFTIRLSNPVAGGTLVAYETVSGSALEGEDFEGQNDTILFEAGETSKTVTVLIASDQLNEGAEDFEVRITDFFPSNDESSIPSEALLIGSGSRAVVTILDEVAERSTATIEPLSATVLEAAGASVTFTIRLSDPLSTATRVAFATVDGSARAGEDFAGLEGTVLFEAGETSKTVTVLITADQLVEGAEDFQVRITDFFPSGETSIPPDLQIGSASTAVVTILDNDQELRLTTGPPGPQTEGDDGTRTFAYTLTRNGHIAEALTVGWGVDFAGGAASPGDFSASEGLLSFAPGQASATATVLVSGDLTPELAETFRLRFTPPEGVTVVGPAVTGTIVNDDLAEAGLVPLTHSLSLAEGDAGATAFTYVLLRTDDVSAAAEAPYAVTPGGANAADFAGPISGAVRFEAGQALAVLTLTVAGDTTAEDHESFTVSVGGGRFTAFQLSGTVINDDPHDGPGKAASAGLVYIAGAADDVVEGGAGQDYLRGSEGDDLLRGGDSFDDLHGNAGNDSVFGGAGDDWVVGGKDADRLAGDDGNDIVLGNLGADTCEGGAGADTIRGGQADDLLTGGGGDDWLSGDRGADTLTGGAGADTFNVFRGSGLDRVLDFHQAEGDRVRLEGGLDYALAQEGADLVLDFGSGDRLVLVGMERAAVTGDWIVAG